MKIIQTKIVTTEYDVALKDEILVFDYEDRVYIKAKVVGIMESGKLKIRCEDGVEFWESLIELADSKSYKFSQKTK